MPLLADIVGSQQKTSSETIRTEVRSFPADAFVPFMFHALPWGGTIATPRVQGLYIKDAGGGGGYVCWAKNRATKDTRPPAPTTHPPKKNKT
jgi:hypothetical protein